MSFVGDTLAGLRRILLLEDDTRRLKDKVSEHAERLVALAEAHAVLRDRVSRLEGVIEGAAMANVRRRIEE
jgi:hypothetical protein